MYSFHFLDEECVIYSFKSYIELLVTIETNKLFLKYELHDIYLHSCLT